MDISRFEGLGDNCEFGFVLESMGDKTGSLFRWAFQPALHMPVILGKNLAGMFQYEHLKPCNETMVYDQYGIAWHTKIRSEFHQGSVRFVTPEAERRKIHASEVIRLQKHIQRFRERAATPGIIYIIRDKDRGIPDDLAKRLHDSLKAFRGNSDFHLLCIHEGKGQPGTVQQIEPGLLYGHVTRFPGYDKAYDVDLASWRSIMEAALAIAPASTRTDGIMKHPLMLLREIKRRLFGRSDNAATRPAA